MTKYSKYVTKDDLKEAVRECIAELMGVASPSDEVLPTKTAYKKLGYSSPKQLYEAINSRLLRIGEEVEDRRKPASKNARLFFNISKCQKRLQTLPEKRSP
jgi:hypothetical protein